jgi:hypothetical protein
MFCVIARESGQWSLLLAIQPMGFAPLNPSYVAAQGALLRFTLNDIVGRSDLTG